MSSGFMLYGFFCLFVSCCTFAPFIFSWEESFIIIINYYLCFTRTVLLGRGKEKLLAQTQVGRKLLLLSKGKNSVKRNNCVVTGGQRAAELFLKFRVNSVLTRKHPTRSISFCLQLLSNKPSLNSSLSLFFLGAHKITFSINFC